MTEPANPQLQPQSLRVDIVSDVVCPWCIIGYLQLMKALEALSGQFEPEIYWHPFELNPDMPEQGQDLREHLVQKYGPQAGSGQSVRSRLTGLGESLGFQFDYYEGMRMVNTFRAHQLLHWAALQGKQTDLKLGLFKAFFTCREDVNDPDVLVQVVERTGLDAGEARVVLDSGLYADAVRTEEAHWRDRDVYAVPMFLFQEKYQVPGAQEADTFIKVLKKIQLKEQA